VKISQREARRLRRRVEQLERNEESRNNRWSGDYVGGVHLWNATVPETVFAAIKVARALGHAVVAVNDDTTHDRVKFFGCKP
jgi:hypothetical protein